MPELRNRKTGVSYVREYGQIVPEHSFGQTSTVSASQFFSQHKKQAPERKVRQQIVKELEKQLPKNESKEEHRKFLELIRQHLDSKEFEILLSSKDVLNSIKELVEEGQSLAAKQAEADTSIASFATTLGTSYVTTLLGSQFPIAMLALSALPVIAAQMSTSTTASTALTTLATSSTTLATTSMVPGPFEIHEGVPKGGVDTCISSLFDVGCLQGYITQDGKLISQFNRIVESIKGSTSVTDPTYTTLRDCLDLNKVGGVVQNVIKTSGTDPKGISCVATSSSWGNYRVTGQASGLGRDDCIAYQNTFNSVVLNCQNAWDRAGRTAAITGGVIGGVLLCACIVGLVVYCSNQRDNDCEPPCCA
ncbi:MAG: hypothetical protein EPN84_09750 [Legionella sp.]|nr:MAG: hypothetical protein EPN84_09750 [Legionella sp.]